MASIFQAYIRLLQKYTLPTQMATGCVTSGLGDLIYQQGVEQKGLASHEFEKTFRLMVYGGCVFAPCANRWHFFMANYIKGATTFTTNAKRLTADMAFFSPFASSMFFTVQGLFQGRSFVTVNEKGQEPISHQIKTNLPSILIRQWSYFGPAQLFNLNFVPLYARPPFMNLVAIGWSAFLASVAKKHSIPEDTPSPTAIAIETME